MHWQFCIHSANVSSEICKVWSQACPAVCPLFVSDVLARVLWRNRMCVLCVYYKRGICKIGLHTTGWAVNRGWLFAVETEKLGILASQTGDEGLEDSWGAPGFGLC